ncbi:MAG: acyl-CoA thioesterase [Kangiellaceae bacterium]|nr:acyl-CoA thioesterase [Kangiellaceae bacterium]
MDFQKFNQQFPVVLPITVAWGEMDAFQHVNNVVYLRYFESARIAYMQAIGMNTDVSDPKNNPNPIGPILADSYCRYRRPVTFPDTLHIGCKIKELQEFGLVMEYQAYSEQQQTIATLGHSRIVVINYFTGQKSQLGDELLNKIKELQPEL